MVIRFLFEKLKGWSCFNLFRGSTTSSNPSDLVFDAKNWKI